MTSPIVYLLSTKGAEQKGGKMYITKKLTLLQNHWHQQFHTKPKELKKKNSQIFHYLSTKLQRHSKQMKPINQPTTLSPHT